MPGSPLTMARNSRGHRVVLLREQLLQDVARWLRAQTAFPAPEALAAELRFAAERMLRDERSRRREVRRSVAGPASVRGGRGSLVVRVVTGTLA